MRPLRLTIVLAPLAILPACAGSGSEAVQMTQDNSPTVTYTYKDPGQYDSVAERADAYCADRYGKDAQLLKSDSVGSGYEATFRCY